MQSGPMFSHGKGTCERIFSYRHRPRGLGLYGSAMSHGPGMLRGSSYTLPRVRESPPFFLVARYRLPPSTKAIVDLCPPWGGCRLDTLKKNRDSVLNQPKLVKIWPTLVKICQKSALVAASTPCSSIEAAHRPAMRQNSRCDGCHPSVRAARRLARQK